MDALPRFAHGLGSLSGGSSIGLVMAACLGWFWGYRGVVACSPQACGLPSIVCVPGNRFIGRWGVWRRGLAGGRLDRSAAARGWALKEGFDDRCSIAASRVRIPCRKFKIKSQTQTTAPQEPTFLMKGYSMNRRLVVVGVVLVAIAVAVAATATAKPKPSGVLTDQAVHHA